MRFLIKDLFQHTEFKPTKMRLILNFVDGFTRNTIFIPIFAA